MRKILLDASVIEEINGGNQTAADQLREFLKPGSTVSVKLALWALEELTNYPDEKQFSGVGQHYPMAASGVLELIKDLGLEVAWDGGKLSDRGDLYDKNLTYYPDLAAQRQ